MIEKKRLMSKENILALFGIFFVTAFIIFIIATSTINSPIQYGNYSTNLNVTVTVDSNGANNMSNITCYYNSSGGAATNFLVQILNITASQTVFTNASINITSIGNSANYNISCFIYNLTSLNNSLSFSNITLDSLPPNISIITPANNTNSSNTHLNVNYTASDNIALSSCWYSNDTFTSNSSIPCGTNITNVTWNNGQHNVTVWTNDTANNLNFSSVSFTVDSIPPTVSNISSPIRNFQNYSGVIILNVSASDLTTGIANLSFNITSTIFHQVYQLNASSTGIFGTSWNATLNTSIIPDGVYNITVWATDYANNINNSIVRSNITFDNTPPAGSVNCNPSTLTVGQTVTCVCTPYDVTSGLIWERF